MYTLCSKLQVGIVVKVIVVEIVEFVTGMPFSGKAWIQALITLNFRHKGVILYTNQVLWLSFQALEL